MAEFSDLLEKTEFTELPATLVLLINLCLRLWKLSVESGYAKPLLKFPTVQFSVASRFVTISFQCCTQEDIQMNTEIAVSIWFDLIKKSASHLPVTSFVGGNINRVTGLLDFSLSLTTSLSLIT